MKKHISFLVALTLIVTSLFTAIPSVRASFSDVPDGHEYKEAITTLNAFNIINGYTDGTFAPDKTITRAEFTKIIVYMLGNGDFTTPINIFSDLPESHWANANIKVAYDKGIVNGFEDGTFRPDEAVTYEQALKMVVCTLGYQVDAEATGGYPDGYRTQATSLKLTDGISGRLYTDGATRGMVAQIMFNALEVPMRELSNNTWVTTDKTLLSDYLNVYKLKGTVVGIEDSTTSYCDTQAYEGQMVVEDLDGTEYVIDYYKYAENIASANAKAEALKSNPDEYSSAYVEAYTKAYPTEYAKALDEVKPLITSLLGQTVQIYYGQERNSEDRWLVQIDTETYKNTDIEIDPTSIESYSDRTLKYYKENSGRTSTIKIDSDLSIRYNGKAVTENVTLGDNVYTPTEALAQWLDPNSEYFIYGSLKLTDTGSTGSYNLIDIYDYDTIVAYAAPNTNDYKIADKTITGNYVVLDTEDVDKKISITKDGRSIGITGISKDDVVNYAVSLDGEMYTVNVTSESVSGTVTSLNLSSSNDKSITIDNKEYKVSDRFITYMQSKEGKELTAGLEIKAYQDMFGTLEWGEISESTTFYPYAYVIDAIFEADDVYLKLFAPSSPSSTSFSSSTSYKVKSYKLANKVKLNGKSSSPTSVASALEENAETANPDVDIANYNATLTGYNQLIKVGFTEGAESDTYEISNVITFDSSVSDTRNTDSSMLVRYKAMDPSAKYYVTSSSVKESSTGSTYYSIRSSTPMFVIPKDRTDSDSYSLKQAVSTNTMTSGGSYYLDAFDLNDTRYPNIVLVYNTTFKKGTAITYSMQYKLVADDLEEVYDSEEGDVLNTITTYDSNTSTTTKSISSEADFSDIEMGDIILYGLDGDGLADSYMKVQDYGEIKNVLKGDPVTYTNANGEEKTQSYYWGETQEQTEENNWQLYKFDWRFPKTGLTEPTDDYFLTGGNATTIRSRAAMFNLLQALTEDNSIYVTTSGFDEAGVIDDSDYLEIKVNSSTRYIRYDSDTEEFTPYALGTEDTKITLNDLRPAEFYGSDCSKILVTYVYTSSSSSTATPTAKFIVIYQ